MLPDFHRYFFDLADRAELSLKAVLFEVICLLHSWPVSWYPPLVWAELSKLILITVMYVGRIGPLVILAAF
jgi:hypothetical protein